MSYTRNFKKTIEAEYSERHRFDTSEKTVSDSNGGSRSVVTKYYYRGANCEIEVDLNDRTISCRGKAFEDVSVNINVDTDPFDESVDTCNTRVNTLTGAVVATSSAEVASIHANSKKVASTIIEGFFKTIRSEISQQIMELQARIDADLVHLNQLSQRCIEKKKQMEMDYRRTSERYTKIFVDLNNELEHRIYELDKPTFQFKSLCSAEENRSTGNDILSTIAITGKESSDVQAKISTSITKRRAFDAIMQANAYLSKQKQTELTINKSMLSDNVSQRLLVPICFIESNNQANQIDKQVYQHNGTLNDSQVNQTISNFENQQWNDAISNNNAELIMKYLNNEIGNNYSANDAHSTRVKENIAKLLDFNKIKSNVK